MSCNFSSCVNNVSRQGIENRNFGLHRNALPFDFLRNQFQNEMTSLNLISFSVS